MIRRQLTLAVATLALLVASASMPAAAAPPPRLEIATAGSSMWTAASHADWTFDNLYPGAAVTSTVRLRTIDAPASGAMVLDLETGAVPGPLLRHIHVTAMSLDGVDLLPLWHTCTPDALTLHTLSTCTAPPDLPAPTASGSTFSMSLALPAATTNDAQGQSTGSFRFVFSLLERGHGDGSHDDNEAGGAGDPSRPDGPGGEGEGSDTGADASTGGSSDSGGSDSGDGGANGSSGGGEAAAPPPASSGHGLGSLTSIVQRVTVPFAALAAATTGALMLLALGRRRTGDAS